MSVHKTLVSDLDYEHKFSVAANHVGFSQSANSKAEGGVISKFSNETTLVLYALYQQATIGPCKEPQPEGSDPSEQIRWMSWNGLAKMAPEDAMKLFVKIVEEEDPGWYLRVLDLTFPDADMKGSSLAPSSYNGEDILLSFGGYNGSDNNEVNVLKPSHAESSLESRLDEIAKRVDALELVRRNLCDKEAYLDKAQLNVLTFITANLAIFIALMIGLLALGREVFHAKGWELYVFFFPMLMVICLGFLMRMAVASRKIRSWRWDQLMINRRKRALKTDVLNVQDLLKLLAGDGNPLGVHRGHFVDIEHRVHELLRSLEDVHDEIYKFYLRFAIGCFFTSVFLFSAAVLG